MYTNFYVNCWSHLWNPGGNSHIQTWLPIEHFREHSEITEGGGMRRKGGGRWKKGTLGGVAEKIDPTRGEGGAEKKIPTLRGGIEKRGNFVVKWGGALKKRPRCVATEGAKNLRPANHFSSCPLSVISDCSLKTDGSFPHMTIQWPYRASCLPPLESIGQPISENKAETLNASVRNRSIFQNQMTTSQPIWMW